MTKTLSQHEYNPHLRKLKESFSLSEKAIKFSIAREIKRAESFSLGIHVLMSFFLVTTYHVIVKTINRHLGLHPLPLKFRMANYFVFFENREAVCPMGGIKLSKLYSYFT